MNSFTSPSLSRPLQGLLVLTVVSTLLSTLLTPFFQSTFSIPGPQYFLALSASGLENMFLWQSLSYLFVQPSSRGIDLNYLLHLFFNSYLLWVLGSTLIQEMGSSRFFRFYFTLSFLVGAGVSLSMLGFQLPQSLEGNTSTLMGLLILWSMFFPEMEVLLFLTFPIKVRLLAMLWLAASLLINLSAGQWVPLAAYSLACVFSYGYGVIFLNLDSPFESLRPLDRLLRKSLLLSLSTSHAPRRQEQKIISLPSQWEEKNPEEPDEEFMDRMLGKISKEGKASLSWEERCRLRNISKKSPNNFDF